jgi:hypothetical protein
MLFFLCFSVLKNDEAASMNICNMYVAQHSKPSLSNYESLFLRSILSFSLRFFFLHRKRVDNTSCCNLYMYTHIYLINIFALFFPFVLSTKQKKKGPNAITFHCYCSMYDRDEMEMRTTKEEKNI